MAAYNWVETDVTSRMPGNALRGGYDADGSHIYVGKAFHQGDWIPSKVIPIKNVAYVAYNGKEHAKNRVQVLCGPQHRFQWVSASNGRVPPCSIEGGKTSTGEALYIGRVRHSGSQTVGKVHPTHGVCYISFGGKEIPFKDYEILIMRG
ncbi:uncharacterized protein [Leptinotarsa decemlineata]|uniref:uncharacterized protein n=1 Tax=Leptinotarsa decemlineata TaxID=7539 RepID=UPI000C251F00|nr:uncharacterized protein LOC111501856 [Leptinotarsa decemlineata]XP_023011537.1 uncharacterized protein LOC111501856 [Leptinotarsa decemlineata]